MSEANSSVRDLMPAGESGDRARTAAAVVALRRAFPQRRLGEVMVLLGQLRRDQLQQVLAYQARSGKPFGECCRRLRLVPPAALERALAYQFAAAPVTVTGAEPAPALAMLNHPGSPYSDAMAGICWRLDARLEAAGQQVVAVTGSGRGIGRSHVAANLAAAFAHRGRRTLLIDADLRNPSQHRLFGVPEHPGLSRLLCGYAPKGVRRDLPGLPNLSLITAGPRPPNPLGLLSGDRLPLLIRRVSADYERVVIDTPCGARHDDAGLIAAVAGASLVVAAKARSRIRAHRRWMSNLARREVKLVGTVLNGD